MYLAGPAALAEILAAVNAALGAFGYFLRDTLYIYIYVSFAYETTVKL